MLIVTYDECHICVHFLSIIMPNAIMLRVVMLSVVVPRVDHYIQHNGTSHKGIQNNNKYFSCAVHLPHTHFALLFLQVIIMT
jgi:hypothetical protein